MEFHGENKGAMNGGNDGKLVEYGLLLGKLKCSAFGTILFQPSSGEGSR